jgi:AcrR family transcriptional regulator
MSAIGRRREAATDEPTAAYLERRQVLLDAAAAVFQAKGFDGMRMDDVVQELDVDRATLYYYFKNKQQLFREVIIDAVTTNVGKAVEIARGEEPAREKLRSLLTSLMDSYDRLYPLLFVYVQEDITKIANDDSKESRHLVKLGNDYEKAVKSIVRQGIEEGEFSDDVPPTLTAQAIIGAANWSYRWFKPRGDLSGFEVGERFADLFLDGLLVGPARRRKRPERQLPSTNS